MSIPKKKNGEWRIGGIHSGNPYDYHEDTVRNRLKRQNKAILKRIKDRLGTPITKTANGIKGTKAPAPLTKRHNKKK